MDCWAANKQVTDDAPVSRRPSRRGPCFAQRKSHTRSVREESGVGTRIAITPRLTMRPHMSRFLNARRGMPKYLSTCLLALAFVSRVGIAEGQTTKAYVATTAQHSIAVIDTAAETV